MTVYVHFNIRSGRKAERLFNVESVNNDGVDAVSVKLMFADGTRKFTDVSHVAVQPERD